MKQNVKILNADQIKLKVPKLAWNYQNIPVELLYIVPWLKAAYFVHLRTLIWTFPMHEKITQGSSYWNWVTEYFHELRMQPRASTSTMMWSTPLCQQHRLRKCQVVNQGKDNLFYFVELVNSQAIFFPQMAWVFHPWHLY